MRITMLLAMLTVGFASLGATAATAAGPTVARAGDGEAGFAVNAFLPEHLTIAAGTTVRWEFPWWEPHTVTLGTAQSGAPSETPSGSDYDGAGFHSSRLLFGPNESYEIRFPKTGEFTIYCIIHPGMVGSVSVVDPTDDIPSQADVDAASRADYAREIASLRSIAEVWASRPITRTPKPDGTAEHLVHIAGETPKGDVQTFFPPVVEIETGDTVRWRSVTVTEHTVTFGPFPGGIPRAGNPAVDEPSSPDGPYRGVGYWNSGMMGVQSPVGVDFAMEFATPGRFFYYCIPHVDQGMTGAVVVSDRTTDPSPAPGDAPLPPATGLGEEHGSETVFGTYVILAGVLCLAGGLAASLAISRRRAGTVSVGPK